jgi:LmbE family N-acetylglucosaminyl deacetylase
MSRADWLRAIAERVLEPSLRGRTLRVLAEAAGARAPDPLERLPGQRLLVIAPHADDEAIGCGGSLRQAASAGAEVHVAVLTDGRGGSRALRALARGTPERDAAEAALVASREEEARAAAAILGVREPHFLRARDGELDPRDARLRADFAALLRRLRPDALLLPFPSDAHPDHRHASGCVLAACADAGSAASMACVGYEVWTPLAANAVVDVGAAIEAKRAAIACYRSQLADLDYLEGALALNRYRAISCLRRAGFAEAFHLTTLAGWRDLCARLAA